MNDVSNEQRLYDLIKICYYNGVVKLITNSKMQITKEHLQDSISYLLGSQVESNNLMKLRTEMYDVWLENVLDDRNQGILIFDYLTYIYKKQVGDNQFKKDAKKLTRYAVKLANIDSIEVLLRHGANKCTTKHLNAILNKIAKANKSNSEHYTKKTIYLFFENGVKADETSLKHVIRINDKELLHRIIIDQKIELSDDFIKSLVNDNPKHQYALELIGKALLNRKLETETCKPKQKQQLRMKI